MREKKARGNSERAQPRARITSTSHDRERYSARQDAKLKMGGVMGKAVYEGDVEPFAPLLALGEVLHVGEGTGMGLGRYRADWFLRPGPRHAKRNEVAG